MTFDEVLDQVRELLRQRGRVTYRSLKLRYQLDDELLAGVTDELISAEHVAVDEDGKVLVWTGDNSLAFSVQGPESGRREQAPLLQTLDSRPRDPRLDVGERRQLTVMFIDLVGSTVLSQQLDPEEYHDHVVAYQNACRAVIARYEGHVAQYLGDGILAYFGYPAAHEDDAARAVHSGLECVAAVSQLAYTPPLQVRIGIHTGPVMVGEIGAGERVEMLALGETPNFAARVQGVAEPNTVFLSPVTQRLVQGLFECQNLGLQTLKGIATPLSLYRVVGESTAQSRFEAAVQTGLTPLVGREEELGLLQRRWEQAKTGAGQVVLLSGEPGIGKSRLVQELKEQVSAEGAICIEYRCSPYHQNSAFYPLIDHLHRLLQFTREDAPEAKLEKLQRTLSRYRFPQADTLPLLAALLSLPHPEGLPPITVSPQKQKEKTQAALVAWLLEEAEQHPVYTVWEDLHWVDPSTLEVITLLLDQIPTTRLLAVLTFRPEFPPPWGNRSYVSQLTVNRLGPSQIAAMIENVTGEKTLAAVVVQQIVDKTDGIPLFVEELTKSAIESVGAKDVSLLQLTIPATLQDSLMARLDRLNTAKELAQLGATMGREFSYELLHAVSPLDEDSLQRGLRQLVEAELVYQHGLLPQAHYLFKHALIQDTAYQSLLKSKRQQLHQQIAQVLEEQFPETKEVQPELLAHHYTEASLIAQAIPYWQQAGQRAVQRSANVEAVAHITKGIEVLTTLPDTPERTQQELTLQLALGLPLTMTKGYVTSEVEAVHRRTLALCQQVGETLLLIPALFNAWFFYMFRAEFQTGRELAERLLALAERTHDAAALLVAHRILAEVLFYGGDLLSAHAHYEHALALYDPQQSRSLITRFGVDFGVNSLAIFAPLLGVLGYLDQARRRNRAALTLVQEIAHPLTTALVWGWDVGFHCTLREAQAVPQRAEALIALCNEQGFSGHSLWGIMVRGWALAMQGQAEDGILQIQQGLTLTRTAGAWLLRPYFLALLAEAYEKAGQMEEGLATLSEALAVADKTGERWYEAELYRLKGELLLQQARKLSD